MLGVKRKKSNILEVSWRKNSNPIPVMCTNGLMKSDRCIVQYLALQKNIGQKETAYNWNMYIIYTDPNIIY